ncbi:MAG: hypothetical protein DRH21_02555 [Deltaproteobacteria bacterium]|nr:MAG: hypothetical protein DRH21_02555 [Deltaproteobacteria bacterium]
MSQKNALKYKLFFFDCNPDKVIFYFEVTLGCDTLPKKPKSTDYATSYHDIYTGVLSVKKRLFQIKMVR